MNNNVVYILGAGFSAPLGIPVMSNFLEKSKDIFAQEPTKYASFGKVFKTIDKMYKATGYFKSDLFNIEEILSILEMSEELSDDSEKSLFVNYIIDVIEYYTPKLQETSYHHDKSPYSLFQYESINYMSGYGHFVGNLLGAAVFQNSQGDLFCNKLNDSYKLSNYSVITLNYDLILENCFSYLRDYFHADKSLGFSQEIENDDNFFIKTHLAKLHGSVSNKKIVPPTWNKGLHEDIREAWRLAYKLLTQANHIRIIGYSLPLADAYVKYLLKSAISHCEHLKSIDVLCLDSKEGSVKQRFDEFITYPKYRFMNKDVRLYLDKIREVCLQEGRYSEGFYMIGLEEAHETVFAY